MHIEPRLNGRATPLEIEPQEVLLDVLRERLRLTGVKRSCEVQVCGTCTVLVDGLPVSCTYLAVETDGREVITIEGLRDSQAYERIADAFTRHAATQCGFCSPAMVLTVHALLAEAAVHDEPMDPEWLRHELAGNLCRCTGYRGILDAVTELAEEVAGSRGAAATGAR